MAWKVSHTHFQDGGFAYGGINNSGNKVQNGAQNGAPASYYKFRIGEKILMYIKYYAIVILSLTLARSWAYCYKIKWTLNHTVIDGERLDFDGKGLQYLSRCAIAVLLILVTLGIFVLWTPAFIKRWEIKHTIIKYN